MRGSVTQMKCCSAAGVGLVTSGQVPRAGTDGARGQEKGISVGRRDCRGRGGHGAEVTAGREVTVVGR